MSSRPLVILLLACCLAVTPSRTIAQNAVEAPQSRGCREASETWLTAPVSFESSTFPPTYRESSRPVRVEIPLSFNIENGALADLQSDASPPDFRDAAFAFLRDRLVPQAGVTCRNIAGVVFFAIGGDGHFTSIKIYPPLDDAFAAMIEDTRVRCGLLMPKDLTTAFPTRAAQREKEGEVVLKADIAADGRAAVKEVLFEAPTGWGFGEAATHMFGAAHFAPRRTPCNDAVFSIPFRLSIDPAAVRR